MATQSMTVRFFILLLATVVVNGVPSISYTGQSCSPASTQVAQRCTSDKTSIVFSSNTVDTFNGTHVLVFVGEPFEITCCTPPKSNSSSDINATLSQRQISYALHAGSPTAELSVLKGNQVNAKLAAYNVTGNNSVCEYSTVFVPKATYSEAGKWICAAYDGNTPRAELQVIVEETGPIHTAFSDIAKEPIAYVSFTANGYSLSTKSDFQVGTNVSNLIPLISNGIYGNGSISITGLQLSTRVGVSCTTATNTYDLAAGGNYTMNACRSNIMTSFNVTRLSPVPENLYLHMDSWLQIGWRRVLKASFQSLLTYRVPAATTTASTTKSGANTSRRNEGGLLMILASSLFVALRSFSQQ